MNKKIISAVLAGVMVISCGALSVSADEVEVEATGAESSFKLSGVTGKIRFEMGDWGHDDKLAFYMWAEKDGEPTQHCLGGEWGPKDTHDVWGTKKNQGEAVEGEDGVIESFEFELPDDSWDVYVIFHDRTTDSQTANCVLTANGMGKTAHMTGEWVENPVDSDKVAASVEFYDAPDCGSHMMITSTGKLTGNVKAPNENGAKVVATYIFDNLGETVKGTDNEPCVSKEKVADAIAKFETNADDVWASYQTFESNENAATKYKPDDAKKVIFGEEEKKDDTSSTESKSDTSSTTSSSTSSTTTSSSTTSSSTTSKSTTTTTTTTAATTSTTAATGTTEAAADTGDSTGTAAFAVVLVGAAVAMVLARKKVED